MSSSESARIHTPVDLHQHDLPDDDLPKAEAIPEEEPSPDASSAPHAFGRLWREDGRVMYQDPVMEKPEAARVVWARPLSGRGGPASVMMAEKKKELAYIPDLAALPEESRNIALEELDDNVVMPVIHEIHRVNPRFGNFYWDVGTDKGRRTFLLLSPESNTYRPGPDSIILRDVSGNCYEIRSVSGLSAASLREMDRVL